MLAAATLLAAASLVASGVLFRHQRWLTFIAAAGVLWEGQWLLLTMLHRTTLVIAAPTVVYTTGALMLLGLWLLVIRNWHWPTFAWRREAAAAAVTLIVLTAVWSVVRVNGWRDDGAWVTHGFYNGDVATLMALVQRSLALDGLVRSNPFAGGGPLEYPTLVHAGLADAFEAFGVGAQWPALLPPLTFLVAGLTVPLFFLLWDVVRPEPDEAWSLWFGVESRAVLHALQAGIVLYALALVWDGYVYPQSHFFITGLFVVVAALLARATSEPWPRELLWTGAAGIGALLLLLTNAVSGTAAVVVMAAFCVWRVADRSRPVISRMLYLPAAALWVPLFWRLAPGEPAFGPLQFPYTAVSSLILLAPAWLALAASAWLARPRDTFIVAAAMVLTLTSFVTFFFSGREIVAENAGRFIYHAIIIGMVLALAPAVRLYYWIKRRLVYESMPLGHRLSIGVSVACAGGILALPALASVASAHDHLQRQDELIVSLAQQETAAWLAANTPTEAVILASTEPPWYVPVFSGRALLRTDYWLSPRDELFAAVEQAFTGNRMMQERVRQEADYLLLTDDEQRYWATDGLEAIYRHEGTVIYKL